jgi:hypothetical protein
VQAAIEQMPVAEPLWFPFSAINGEKSNSERALLDDCIEQLS